MAHADRDWRLIREEARDGPMNMALDEVAAGTAGSGGVRTLRVYRWQPSTLSLGYRQPVDTVDWEYCRREGITVTRRPTGGGGIYHDVDGDISYSIVAPTAEFPGDLMDAYRILLGPIFDALARMDVDAGFPDEERPALYEPACYLRALNPAHDVVVDGRKLSGNAQYRQREAVIQHGSITYARATERHLGVFADPDVTPTVFDTHVTSIREHAGIDREQAVTTLETALAEWADAEVGDWTDEELSKARDLVEEKYHTDSWTGRI